MKNLLSLIILLMLTGCGGCFRDDGTMSSEQKSHYESFTINGINLSPIMGQGDLIESQLSEGVDYLKVNQGAVITLGVLSTKEEPIWVINNETTLRGATITVPMDREGFNKIALVMPSNESIVKIVKVVSGSTDVENFTSDPANMDASLSIDNGYADNNHTQPIISGQRYEDRMPSNKRSVANAPISKPGNNTDIPENKPPKEPVEDNFTHNNVSEGANSAAKCDQAEWSESARVSFSPKSNAELVSCKVYANEAGSVNIALYENGRNIKTLNGRTVNIGKSELRLSTLHTTLIAGNNYELRIVGVGSVRLADLSPCNASGGGSILKPSYGGQVSVFNITFNY